MTQGQRRQQRKPQPQHQHQRRGVAASQLQAARRRKRHREVIRNRIIFGVVCLAILILVIFLIYKLVTALLSGVGSSASDTSRLTFEEDGSLTFEEVTDLDSADYDKDQLKDYVTGLIDSFNETYGSEAITLEECSVKSDQAYVKTSYDSPDTYTSFTSYVTYCDTVENAYEAGYDFTDTFDTVSDGAKGQVVETSGISDFTGMQVAIVKENVQVVVPGDIAYISDRSTELVDSHTVNISPADGNMDSADLVYIIYSTDTAAE